jgi:urease accessory protein
VSGVRVKPAPAAQKRGAPPLQRARPRDGTAWHITCSKRDACGREATPGPIDFNVITGAPVIDRFDSSVGQAPPQRTSGELEVVFRRRDGATVVERLYQEGAARARLPREDARGLRDVTLINLAGGLTGGDVFSQRLVWADGAAAGATTQAAEKIYRAAAGSVTIRTELQVGRGAWAEWLPQETILFEGAALDRRLCVDVAGDGRLLAVEPIVFGRLAMGERVRYGRLTDRLDVRVDGRRVWLDVNRLVPPVDALLDRPALGDGARAVATLLYVGADAAARLVALRAIVAEAPVTAAVSRLDAVVVARLVAPAPATLRRALVEVLERARAALGAWPPQLPRAWHI